MSGKKIKTDLEIAQGAKLLPIKEVAQKLNVSEAALFKYGEFIAKIDTIKHKKTTANKGKLVLVTALTPTTAGEGKTTMSIGLADALNIINTQKQTVLALREPSLGPVFGMKGGATGGGHAQVVPMETINLHFTGDIHAIGAAGNLLAAMIDNHIYQGNTLKIAPETITWKRSVDMNDRQLRQIQSGLGSKFNGVPREDGFEITVASEVMAILCLATDLADLKKRLGQITIGYTVAGERVTARDLQAEDAMTIILKDALLPNLVQTLEHTPVLLHGGPFANIAHGCNSIIATKFGLENADIVVTEAGFGSDLGAEKFMDIKMREAGLYPDACVLVGTIRALKLHAGIPETDLAIENVDAILAGMPNLLHHYNQMDKNFNLKSHVVMNLFPTDTQAEIDAVISFLEKKNICVTLSTAWRDGGEGSVALAKKVLADLERKQASKQRFVYELSDSLSTKINKIAQNVYGATQAIFSEKAQQQLNQFSNDTAISQLPICIAKTQYSLTDKPKIKNVSQTPFTILIKELKLATGAGFIIATAGNILTMPGLPENPAAVGMEIDKDGTITGLY